MKIYFLELMCIAVYACFAIAGFYFVAQERREARAERGPRVPVSPSGSQLEVARQGYTSQESEQPHKVL